MMRYLRLYRAFLVNCLARAMEFRAQFFAGIIGYAIWTGLTLVFIDAVFSRVGVVRGWSRDQMWVLYGTSVVLESLCWGVLGPNMLRFSTQIRDGTLDLALTKPVNLQFFVSARYLDLNGCLNAVVGFVLMFTAFSRLGRWPSPVEWVVWLFLTSCGFIMAYAIWFAFVTISVWAVKLEGIAVIFDPIMQLARFPIQIYPQRALLFLTIGLPIAFLTTFPAQALLGRIEPGIMGGAVGMAAVLLFLSNRFFNFALGFYGSASS